MGDGVFILKKNFVRREDGREAVSFPRIRSFSASLRASKKVEGRTWWM